MVDEKTEEQLRLDVNRSLHNYIRMGDTVSLKDDTVGASEGETMRSRADTMAAAAAAEETTTTTRDALHRVMRDVLQRNSTMNYYQARASPACPTAVTLAGAVRSETTRLCAPRCRWQGYHDVAAVFLLKCKNEAAASRMLERVSRSHLQFALTENLLRTRAVLALLMPLLELEDPEVLQLFRRAEVRAAVRAATPPLARAGPRPPLPCALTSPASCASPCLPRGCVRGCAGGPT